MPLFWICLAFILGIAAAPFLSLPHHIILTIIIVALLIAYAEKRLSQCQPHPLLHNSLFKIPASVLLVAGLSGLLLFQSSLPKIQENSIYRFAGSSHVTLNGLVSADPDITSRYTSATITCHTVLVDGQSYRVRGKTRIILPQGFLIRYGDIVEIHGEIKSTFNQDEPPFTSRDGREKIFTKMEYPDVKIKATDEGNPMLSALFRVRERANRVIFDMMPFPESSVLSGILLGLETSIPGYLWNGYRASGIAHIIVISGFNISVITHLIFRAFSTGKLKGIALPLTIGIVTLYTILVGGDTPVIRAAIMASIALPAAGIGRKSISIHNLIMAAAFILAFNPFLLWDISFQLSFLATLALQVMADPIIRWIAHLIYRDEEKVNSRHAVLELVVTTLCASVVVFPILFRLTGTISLVSIPANLIVGPLQPLIMTAGGGSVLIGLVSPLISRILGVFVWPLIALCNQVALRLSAHPSATVFLPKWVYYLSLCLVTLILGYFCV